MELVVKSNKKETVTSLELLEQINFFRREEGNRSELEHRNLLSIIRDEFKEEISLLEIKQREYFNSRNQKQPMFELTLNQAKRVLTRESIFVRKAVFEYIEKLEERLKYEVHKLPTTYLEALEELVAREKMLIEQKPKVDYYDKVLDTSNSFNTTVIAKELGMSAKELNKLLNSLGVIYKIGEQWFLYAPFQDLGYTNTSTFIDDKNKSHHRTLWTEKGREFIIDLVNKHFKK